MRTSRFYSPNHPAKIVDFISELISLFYYKNNLNKTCNIFSHLYDNHITISGLINSDEHPTDSEIISYIKDITNVDYNVNLNLIKSDYTNVFNSNLGTFIGYANTENSEHLPFEHYYVKQIIKSLYNVIQIPIMCQLTINGNISKIILEHNFNDANFIENFILDVCIPTLDNLNSDNVEFIHKKIDYNNVYNSGNNHIYNLYGPRTSYGDISYVGSDIISRERTSIIIARNIALNHLFGDNLQYSQVEITYGINNTEPIQIGIKGNSNGIHIEHGTFFKYGTLDEFNLVKNNLIFTEESVINSIKWGI